MNDQSVSLAVLGTRGSVPTCGKDTELFGGQTSCYQLTAGSQTLLLDAGTGLLDAELPGDGDVAVVLSHTHIDHILGLTMFPALLQPERTVHLYGMTLEGRTLSGQLARLMSPPLWPVGLEELPARVVFHELEARQTICGMTVEAIEGSHPGGCAVLRVTAGGKTVVYATDFEHTPEKTAQLEAFARGASLLLYDGQYTPEQFSQCVGFGHSTAEEGGRLFKACGAEKLRLIHLDPWASDETLLARERELGLSFAKRGEVIRL